MFTLSSPAPAVKSTKVTLTDRPQVVSARRARGMVRRAAYVAVYVTTSSGGAADILDTSKARVLKMLARRDHAWVSDIFGTVIIGRPNRSPSRAPGATPRTRTADHEPPRGRGIALPGPDRTIPYPESPLQELRT